MRPADFGDHRLSCAPHSRDAAVQALKRGNAGALTPPTVHEWEAVTEKDLASTRGGLQLDEARAWFHRRVS